MVVGGGIPSFHTKLLSKCMAQPVLTIIHSSLNEDGWHRIKYWDLKVIHFNEDKWRPNKSHYQKLPKDLVDCKKKCIEVEGLACRELSSIKVKTIWNIEVETWMIVTILSIWTPYALLLVQLSPNRLFFEFYKGLSFFNWRIRKCEQ